MTDDDDDVVRKIHRTPNAWEWYGTVHVGLAETTREAGNEDRINAGHDIAVSKSVTFKICS